MKTLRFLGMLLLGMCLSFGMVACGGSDNDDNGGGSNGATGWEGDWLITASSDFSTYPASIQVLTLDRSTGKFYSTYFITEDGEFYGGSVAYGSLSVNEKNSTMTMNGVTVEYEVEGNKIIFYGGSTSTTYYRLNSEQKTVFQEWGKKAAGHIYTYEIESGSGGVVPGGGGSGGGGTATSSDIVGSWYNYFTENGYQYYEIYTFGSDGILSYTILLSTDGKTWYKDDQESVSYSVKGSVVYVGGDGTSYSVSGNKLNLGGEILYKVTSDIQKIWNSAIAL